MRTHINNTSILNSLWKIPTASPSSVQIHSTVFFPPLGLLHIQSAEALTNSVKMLTSHFIKAFSSGDKLQRMMSVIMAGLEKPWVSAKGPFSVKRQANLGVISLWICLTYEGLGSSKIMDSDYHSWVFPRRCCKGAAFNLKLELSQMQKDTCVAALKVIKLT